MRRKQNVLSFNHCQEEYLYHVLPQSSFLDFPCTFKPPDLDLHVYNVTVSTFQYLFHEALNLDVVNRCPLLIAIHYWIVQQLQPRLKCMKVSLRYMTCAAFPKVQLNLLFIDNTSIDKSKKNITEVGDSLPSR